MKILKETPQEIIEICEKEIDKFNEGKSDDNGFYVITTSGQMREYFCLWSFNPIAIFKPYNFIQNLSKDFELAVKKAISMIENSLRKLMIDDYDSMKYEEKDHYTFTFGKYKNRTVDEIADEDIQYLIWMVNTYYNSEKYQNNSKKFNSLLEKAQAHVNFYFDKLAEKNRKEFKSQYVGEIGETVGNFKLTVTGFKVFVDNYRSNSWNGYYYVQEINAKDSDGNFYIIRKRDNTPTRGNEGYKGKTYERLDEIFVKTARIMEHKEICGIKRTRLGYVNLN